LVVAGVVLVGLAAPAVSMGAAQDGADPSHPAHIHSGTCGDLGEIVAPLNNVAAVAGGEFGGAELASPVQASASEVDLALADILAAPHAVNVHESADDIGVYIACGEIGGRVVEGRLAIGLRELNGSDQSGVAVLETDANDETDVTIYLVEEGATAGVEEAAGGDEAAADEVDEAATAAAPTAAPAAPTAAPAATEEPTAEPAAEAAPAGEEVAVDIRDFSFAPDPIEVAVGDTITWTNQDPVPHTATATERDVLQSGAISPDGGSFSQTFETAGEFSYFCEFHPNMEGTIVVE
jgi:plastocyanin